jgi:hypothetical protein
MPKVGTPKRPVEPAETRIRARRWEEPGDAARYS